MLITVILSAALLCTPTECHHALVGVDTPTGEYTAVKTPYDRPFYGGDLAPFAQDARGNAYSVHRTWLGNPSERRQWRLEQDDPALRVISLGCINVAPEVYDRLPDVFDLEIIE